MAKTENLKSIIIDVEKGIYEVNGEDIGKDTSELHLDFENGVWSLAVTRDMQFTTSDKQITE